MIAILSAIYTQVQIDVKINDWFGKFYNTLQEALASPNSVTLGEFYSYLIEFAFLAGIYVIIAVSVAFFTSHWSFRWRNSMAEHYHIKWAKDVEGASQRVQEDTLKFARILETLGIGLVEALMVLAAFLPLLYTLSAQITELPFFGQVDGSLVYVAALTALGGTVLLATVGRKLPGIEYDIQKREASYRKHLVLAEDGEIKPKEIKQLYAEVKKIHYNSFFHYLYFDATKWTFLQSMVVVPYIALAPTIVTGAVTLGFITQISRAFGKVAESLQYVVRSWSIIVELLSIHKRLKEYERTFK